MNEFVCRHEELGPPLTKCKLSKIFAYFEFSLNATICTVFSAYKVRSRNILHEI